MAKVQFTGRPASPIAEEEGESSTTAMTPAPEAARTSSTASVIKNNNCDSEESAASTIPETTTADEDDRTPPRDDDGDASSKFSGQSAQHPSSPTPARSIPNNNGDEVIENVRGDDHIALPPPSEKEYDFHSKPLHQSIREEDDPGAAGGDASWSSNNDSSDEFFTESLKGDLSELAPPPVEEQSKQIQPGPPPNSEVQEKQPETNSAPKETAEIDDDDDPSSTEESEDDEDEDLSLLWKARLLSGKVVNYEYVQIAIIFLIIINAMMMGLGTFDFVTDDPHVEQIFEDIDRVFLVIFTMEVAMQLFYLGVTLFSDGWLVFDFFIVVFSWSFESLQIVRAFRIFRAFRLITRVKPLRDLVLAIGAVLPRMYAIGGLLLLVFYIFSVLFTELFKDLELSANYFGTLGASLFTCMELMTLEWAGIAREVMTIYKWAWAPLASFIALTGFIVFNLIIAVVCDAVAVTEKTVREMDGIESDNPLQKLDEAQERIDLLQCHIDDMLHTQQAIQEMIEIMAGELLHLEAERLKSEQREVDMKLELGRMLEYGRSMEAARKSQILERSSLSQRGDLDRRSAHRRDSLSASRHESGHDRRSMNRRQNSNDSLNAPGSTHNRRRQNAAMASPKSPKASFVVGTSKSPKPTSRRALLSESSYRSSKSGESRSRASTSGSKSKLSITTGSDRSLLTDD
jgi:hypothetical protein